jgi:hypothetical protein
VGVGWFVIEGKQSDLVPKGPKEMDRYPRECGVLVAAREPTERERWIDLRPGAENPLTPTKKCGATISDAEADRHDWASAHPDLWATIQLLAQVRAEVRSGRRA